MKFRAYLLFGALFAVIASAPLRWRIGIGVFLAVWLGVDLLAYELRQRRARKMAAERGSVPGFELWVDCEAHYSAPFGADPHHGGLRGACAKEKGHSGLHEAVVDVEWLD